MGEYEPNDSRNVTLKDGHAPGEPPRTGPREGQTRIEGDAESNKEKAEGDRETLEAEERVVATDPKPKASDEGGSWRDAEGQPR